MDYSNLTKNEYSRLVGYSIGILNKKNYTHIEGKDIVHNAFINMYNNGEEYSFEKMKPFLLQEITAFTNQLFNSNTIGMVQKKSESIFAGIEMKNCKCCDVLLPVSFFYILRKYPDGLITYHTNCKECHKKLCAIARAKKLSDPIYYETYLQKASILGKKKRALIKGNPLLKSYFGKKRSDQEKIYRERKKANKISGGNALLY